MSKKMFTPGPWKIVRYNGFEKDPSFMGEIVSTTGKIVYQGPMSFRALSAGNRKESDANARLIAASPEMYELLEKMLGLELPQYAREQITNLLQSITHV